MSEEINRWGGVDRKRSFYANSDEDTFDQFKHHKDISM